LSRLPTTTLVVDAAILVAAARGRGSGAVLLVASACRLVTTDRAISEARRRIQLGLKRPELLPVLEGLCDHLSIIPVAAMTELVLEAEIALRDAVPSRNGSITDAHLLATAWALEADVWSPDRDFAGTGVASWSTANLVQAVALAS
jgi:predicted nucleic acid-binding protein